MFKYTPSVLEKLETLLGEADYVVRYEKGNFKAGYCLLKDKRVIVVNKYYNTESRINCFLELMPKLDLREENLSDGSHKLLKQIKAPAAQP
ncbi:MAG TPA: hypothetical protein VEY71_05860 [Chitinophagales bacterium]|nr:hypothetical protein [Chitinophagales bacterium]